MDTFDNVINKAKEAIDVVCKKTGEVVNTEKQKFDISTLKSKREKDFARLGEIYFEAVKDDEAADEKVKEIVNEIKQKNEKIDKLTAEILGTKYKRVCPNCGAGIDFNAPFCSACGAKLEFSSDDKD